MIRSLRRRIGAANGQGTAADRLSHVQRKLERTEERLEQRRAKLADLEERIGLAQERLDRKRLRLKALVRDDLLASMPRESVCAEIGVDEGRFSQRILEIVKPRRLHLIDPWSDVHEDKYGGVISKFAQAIQAGQVEVHRETSRAAADRFEKASLDWVYIDGNHTYDYVREDLELYFPRVRPGGHVAGDDYGNKAYGVQRAVDEFVAGRADAVLEVMDANQFVITRGA